MSTHMTKTWFVDGQFIEQVIPEAEIYKRQWVGLTDDEATAVYAETEGKVNEHWNNGGTAMMFPPALYKAIEAKLKEKNT